jgi:hypothetical protein
MEREPMTSEEKQSVHELEHEREKIAAFAEQQAVMDKIREIGFARYAESLPNLKDAFDLDKHQPREGIHNCVCCMDEGTPWGIHAAGSGILLSDEEFDLWFDRVKPDCLSDHDGCGAKEVKARHLMEKFGIDFEMAMKMVEHWVEKKAQEKGVKFIKISAAEMNRPDFHDAPLAYYDGTGSFNYEGVEGLPKGFVVSRLYLGKEPALNEDGVAEAIIFGPHGYGNDEKFFNEKRPFVFVAVGKSPEDLASLKNELAEFSHSHGDRIIIDGFVAPKG